MVGNVVYYYALLLIIDPIAKILFIKVALWSVKRVGKLILAETQQ